MSGRLARSVSASCRPLISGITGIQLAEEMLDRNPEVGLVLLSGYTSETLDLERVTAHGATFLPKPATGSQLVRAVHMARASARSAG